LAFTEILVHILSHLQPETNSALALVSKRFYSLVTTPHAWRMAFLRYFPGRDSLEKKHRNPASGVWDEEISDFVRSEARYFTRLTPLATWRSEYLFRTRLLRSLARGKPGKDPGAVGPAIRSSGKKVSAVLTYNSKLPWAVTNLHAIFPSGKKAPKAIHGVADLGVGTVSDPTTGKVENWGFEDPFSIAQLDEMFPNLQPYGLGDGPAALPNVMDVSQAYGFVAGEGFPGGRAYFRPINEFRGRYLSQESDVIDAYADIPKIPELSEAISSVWMARSSAVPTVTQSMVGILTGSTLGVVTAYGLGFDPTARYANGDMTVRWVLSPGVPIISIKVDESYSLKRKASQRVWAVALNALGEVYYLTETPTPVISDTRRGNVTKNAWHAGRSVYWQLLESTRRKARPDELEKNVIRGAYTPRSPANSMNLSKEQMIAEAREIEKFLLYKPSYFRKVCHGWDMRRKLEVDFANDDERSAGESIFVIDCGHGEGQTARVVRHTRSITSNTNLRGTGALASPTLSRTASDNNTLFATTPASSQAIQHSPQGSFGEAIYEWDFTLLASKELASTTITASAIDMSNHAVLAISEEVQHPGNQSMATPNMTPGTAEGLGDIPGRRSRLLAIGTERGLVIVWNCRESSAKTDGVHPVRIIQTESPQVSCVALTALYLVHGGNDGLVQAWDPLASNLEPIRTLSARSSGRVPRHMMTMNPALQSANYAAVGAIYLDPDPTILRGVVSFGAFLRYWAYSSTGQPAGRKRRLRHADFHGRLTTRRQGGNVSGYIAAETAELRREQEHQIREQARLRSRFGVGALGDLTEEEAVRYAKMISEESYALDEQRRTSASDTGSTADVGTDTPSSFSGSSMGTITPEPSISGFSPQSIDLIEEEEEYQEQIQRAIRLSMLEGVNDVGQSPRGNSSGEYDFSIKYKHKPGKRGKNSSCSSPSPSHTPIVWSKQTGASKPVSKQDDEDLALALHLSLQEQEQASGSRSSSSMSLGIEPGDFPPLASKIPGKGKAKGKQV
jgi:hypothetical protein